MRRSSEPARAGDPLLDDAAEQRWLRTDTVLLAAALGVLLWAIGDVLLLIFAGILLAVGLDGLAGALSRRTPLSHGWALALVGMVFLALLIVAGVAIVPQFLAQIDQLWQRLTEVGNRIWETLSRYGWAQQLTGGENGQGQQLTELAGGVASRVASATLTALGVLGDLIILIVIALFGAADPDLYRRGLLKLVPLGHRARLDETLTATALALRSWFLGQIVAMALMGVTVSLGLWMIGVDLWLGLGVLAGLLNFIPFLGPVIAGIPMLAVGFAQDVQTGLMVLAFFLVVQNVEGNVLTPMIQHRAVHLPPVLLIGVQVLLGTLFGALGLILAAPVAVVGLSLVNHLYVEDVLGDERATP